MLRAAVTASVNVSGVSFKPIHLLSGVYAGVIFSFMEGPSKIADPLGWI